MQRFLFFLGIFLVLIILINIDSIVRKANDFKEPTFDIGVVRGTLFEKDGDLTFIVRLINVSDNPIFVDKLNISYIYFIDDNRYELKSRNIEVRETIDKEDPVKITVFLPDYINLKFEPSASQWIKEKRKNFGIEISVKDNSDETIQWTKIKLDS